ncbi:S8 family serine peptidase [Streptomyces sp. NPDC060030]|uniref:S8 family serine peptidase n=1 Tax=Streptomyces sp. NPDC060030 TaxID=3347042 RepID=UPI003698F835
MVSAVMATTAALLAGTPPTADASAGSATTRVIVQLSRAPASHGTRFDAADGIHNTRIAAERLAIAATQDTFLSKARSAGVRPDSVRRFTLLSNAVAMTVAEGQLAALRRLPGVVSVHPDAPARTMTDVSVPLIGADDVWKKVAPNGSAARGKGVTVAVIDSGVDYGHPDLGGGFGPGHKVVAGHDFVNGDEDPMDDNGHGTHVAGIIAGKAAKPGGITGVAPDAELTAYKVMNENGEGYESDLIAGLEAATDPANPHRADVVNMSVGTAGDGTDPVGLAATEAVRAGVVVVAAAGNAGPGPSTVGSPAAADGVIAVGASTSGVRVPSARYDDGDRSGLVQAQPWVMSANGPAEPVSLPIVPIGTGDPEVNWGEIGSVRGKALLLERDLPPAAVGWFTLLAREAEKRGAVALFAGVPDSVTPAVSAERGVLPFRPSMPHVSESGDDLRFDSLVVMTLDTYAYREMAARAAQRKKLELLSTDATDHIASFSSRGPVAGTFALKPDIVAPGVKIRSTMYSPWTAGVYRMSGTSMAAPHVAGAAALIRQLRPSATAQAVSSALVNSAEPLVGPDVTTQGAGRLDVAAAAESVLTASPVSLSLGIADLGSSTVRATRTVAVSNPGTRPVKALVKVTGGAKVTPSRVSLAPGATTEIVLKVSARRPALDTDTDFGGRITLRPDRGAALTVPYLFAVRPLTVQTTPDPSDGRSTAYIHTPVRLASAPVVRVTPPKGRSITVSSVPERADWYTVPLTGTQPGVYRVDVTARTLDGKTLLGADAFEVTPEATPDTTWRPVGPDGEAGALTTAPTAPSQAVMIQPGKTAPWLTEDKGASWRQVNRLPVAGGSGDVVIDPVDADHWWYSVADTAMGRSHVLQTRDNGRTWQILTTVDAQILSFVSDAKARALVAVTPTELLVSRDGGGTWTPIPMGMPEEPVQATVGGDTLYLRSSSSVWAVSKITDDRPAPARPVLRSFVLDGLAADGDMVAAYEITEGVVVSQDRGRTWSRTLDLQSVGSGLTMTGGDLFVGAGADGRSWVSHDHGSTWQHQPARPGRPSDYDRWADGTLTVSVNQDGVYRSAADGTGAHRIGVQGLTVHDLAVSGTHLVAGTANGTYRTALPVESPEWDLSGQVECYGCLAQDVVTTGASTMWRTTALAAGAFTVDRSTDGGRTWTTLGSHAGFPTALTVDETDPRRAYAAYSTGTEAGVFTTGDGGTSWETLHQDHAFTSMAADPGHRGRLWLGTDDGLYRSDDYGDTVTRVADGPVDSITLDAGRLIIGGLGIRISKDGGRTFAAADMGGLPTRVSDVLRVGRTLYAATAAHRPNGLLRGGRGVLRSTDDGRTWGNVSTGLQNLDATSLAVSSDSSALYVGTVDGGVHRMGLRH